MVSKTLAIKNNLKNGQDQTKMTALGAVSQTALKAVHEFELCR